MQSGMPRPATDVEGATAIQALHRSDRVGSALNEQGGFVVTVPALPGCVTQGEARDEAVAMARDCIEGFMARLAEPGEPIPVESEPADAVAVWMEVAGPVAA